MSVDALNAGMKRIFPDLAKKTEPEFNRFMYNLQGYYIYNSCLLIQMVVGVALPIFRVFGGVSFATGFWFLAVAEIIKRPLFSRLIQHEVFKPQHEHEADVKRGSEGCLCSSRTTRDYLRDRRSGDAYPEEDNSRRVLLACKQDPGKYKDGNGKLTFNAVLWIFGLIPGFGHMDSAQ